MTWDTIIQHITVTETHHDTPMRDYAYFYTQHGILLEGEAIELRSADMDTVRFKRYRNITVKRNLTTIG